MDRQWNQDRQNNFEKEKKKEFTLPNFKIDYKVTIIQTVCYWQNDTQISMEENKDSKNYPGMYSQMIMEKGRLLNTWC